MIRFLLRFIGLLGLALAFVFLVYDGTRSIANRTVDLTTFERFWNEVYQRSPQDVLKPSIAPIANWIWDPVVVSILGAPIWLILAVVASVLMILGRKRKPLIGYARDRS
jgi:ABC-type phosphate transport system permease subunit